MIETVVGVESGQLATGAFHEYAVGLDSSRRVAVRVVAGCKSRTTTFKTAAEQAPES
ncbi:hypothetical protein [Mycobacterium sp. URHB0021]|jgi:hypothetical protein